LITQLGQYANYEAELKEIHSYRDTSKVDLAFKELKQHWESYLVKYQIKTPDKNFDTMVNIHNPKQSLTTKNLSRFLSLYQLGLGARGIGFRGTPQDLIGVMGLCHAETTDMMSKLLSTQRMDGSAMHQFFPLTMEATNGDSSEMEDRYDFYGDDHLWIIQTIAEYIKESADFDFLNKVVPYYEKDQHEQPKDEGTVFDHMCRAIEFTRSHVGSHGIPLLGFADWNDTVNLPMGAESIFNADLYGKALIELIALCQFQDKSDFVEKFQGYYDDMKKSVNEHLWDGDWYIRYFDHKGVPLGSKINQYGSIFTNAQSWTVFSGFATDERATRALESVNEKLNTAKGIKLSFPGFNGYDPEKGGVSTYPPGAKENGGIFLHSNPWVIIAETMLGHGDLAYEYYNQINPITKNDIIDEFEVEPYVYPQNILGDEHPQFGLGRNSWLSGTASWAYQASTKYIMGIRADYDGLVIDPCVPRKWDRFEITKHFRGATYQITVYNPKQVSKGIEKMIIDGIDYTGNKVPVFNDGKVHRIEAFMG
nr:glycosyl transferase [Vallitaleaceae bacterium]